MPIYTQILRKVIKGAVFASFALTFAYNTAHASMDLPSFSGVPAPKPLCVLADDFGDLVRQRETANASGEGAVVNGVFIQSPPSGWLNTKINLIAGMPLKIRTSGAVELCAGAGGAPVTHTLNVTPTVGPWQATGIYLTKGSKYQITVNGGYSNWSSNTSCGGADKYNDANCWAWQGRGIFAYIGQTPPASNWYGNDVQDSGVDPEFFELHNYSTGAAGYNYTPTGSVLDNTISNAIWGNNGRAQLYIRYRDSVRNAVSSSAIWTGGYADNRVSGHTITVTQWERCPGEKGEFLVAYVGDNPPSTISNISTTNPIILHRYAQQDNTVTPPREAGVYDDGVPGAGGKLWLKVIDSPTIDWDNDGRIRGDGDYTPYNIETGTGSNSGSYVVDIVTPKPAPEGISKFINNIVDPIREFLLGDQTANPPIPGITGKLYKGITGNINFVLMVRAAMALSIVFFAFTYMIGLSNITQKELLQLAVKMSIVITLVGPTSWEFFYRYLFSLFIDGTNDLIYLVTSQFAQITNGASFTNAFGQVTSLDTGTGSQAHDAFAFINQTMARFFTKETQLKLVGLLAAFPLGTILAIVLYAGVGLFLFAVFKAILLYITAIVMTSLLLFLAPIFITFILFNRTKTFFEKWVKQLMSFALQPVLLFTILAIFNVFIFSVLYLLLSFSVCWSCILHLDLGISEKLSFISGQSFPNFDNICVASSYLPWGFDSSQSISVKLMKTPVDLFLVLILIILANAMMKFIDWIAEVAGILTAGVDAVGAGGIVNRGIKEATNTAKFGGKAGLGAGKFAAGIADKATGHLVSDSVKKSVRRNLPSFASKGGESDGMGGKTRYAKKFMTSIEKRALNREQKFFNKMKDSEKRDYIKMKKDERKNRSLMSDSEKRAYDKQQQKNTEQLGGTSNSKFDGSKYNKDAKRLLNKRSELSKGYADLEPEEQEAHRKRMAKKLKEYQDMTPKQRRNPPAPPLDFPSGDNNDE